MIRIRLPLYRAVIAIIALVPLAFFAQVPGIIAWTVIVFFLSLEWYHHTIFAWLVWKIFHTKKRVTHIGSFLSDSYEVGIDHCGSMFYVWAKCISPQKILIYNDGVTNEYTLNSDTLAQLCKDWNVATASVITVKRYGNEHHLEAFHHGPLESLGETYVRLEFRGQDLLVESLATKGGISQAIAVHARRFCRDLTAQTGVFTALLPTPLMMMPKNMNFVRRETRSPLGHTTFFFSAPKHAVSYTFNKIRARQVCSTVTITQQGCGTNLYAVTNPTSSKILPAPFMKYLSVKNSWGWGWMTGHWRVQPVDFHTRVTDIEIPVLQDKVLLSTINQKSFYLQLMGTTFQHINLTGHEGISFFYILLLRSIATSIPVHVVGTLPPWLVAMGYEQPSQSPYCFVLPGMQIPDDLHVSTIITCHEPYLGYPENTSIRVDSGVMHIFDNDRETHKIPCVVNLSEQAFLRRISSREVERA